VEKVIQLWSQHQTAFAVGAVVVLVFALLVLVQLVIRARRRQQGERLGRKLAHDLVKGNYEGAAERELEAGHLSAAYDLFLRARQPVRAAHIAVRQGRLQEAAELFEKAGSRKRAADLYNQAGMETKAEELLAEEERMARERQEQKAALRKRLEAEPEEDVASLDRSPPPAKPAPRASDLGDPAAAPRGSEVNLASAPARETPSHFGIQALVDPAAGKAASQDLALAPTQAAMASFAAAFETSIVTRGVEPEDLALCYVADAAVSEARQGPAVEDLQRALAARGGAEGAEDTLYQLGLALVGAASVAGLPTLPALASPATPAPPPGEELSWDEARPVREKLSFGDVNPAVEELPSGGAKSAKAEILIDSPPPTPEPPAAIVEGLAETAPRATRTTPRTPIPVVSPSLGAYRMVRPSEPEVFTPPPSLRPNSGEGAKSRLAQLPRPASGEHPIGEVRLPTPTPRLALGTKPGRGESPPRHTHTPAGSTLPLPDGPRPTPPPPAPVPRACPQGTVLGIGPGRPGK